MNDPIEGCNEWIIQLQQVHNVCSLSCQQKIDGINLCCRCLRRENDRWDQLQQKYWFAVALEQTNQRFSVFFHGWSCRLSLSLLRRWNRDALSCFELLRRKHKQIENNFLPFKRLLSKDYILLPFEDYAVDCCIHNACGLVLSLVLSVKILGWPSKISARQK